MVNKVADQFYCSKKLILDEIMLDETAISNAHSNFDIKTKQWKHRGGGENCISGFGEYVTWKYVSFLPFMPVNFCSRSYILSSYLVFLKNSFFRVLSNQPAVYTT